MIDAPFRRALPRFAGPLLRCYAQAGLSPNALSGIACTLALLAALCTASGWAWPAIALWWLGRLVDGTDGLHARRSGRASDFGAYLDILLDMTAYSAMVLGFAQLHPELHSRWLWILLLYVLCITSALALGAQEARRRLPPRDERGLRLGAGLAEGGETGIAYTLFLLFPHRIETLSALWLALLVLTVLARTALAGRLLSDPPHPGGAAAVTGNCVERPER